LKCPVYPLLKNWAVETALKAKGNIRRNRAPLEERPGVVLENDDNPVRRAIDRIATKPDVPRTRGRQPAEQSKQ